MSLGTASGLASFDNTDGQALDISEVIAALIVSDPGLLGRIGMGAAAFETTHYWLEEALNGRTVTQEAAALNDSATTLTITEDQGNKLRIGALLKDTASGKSEVVQVTAITTTALTIVRGYGSTSGEAHDASAVWRIVSQPVQENDKNTADRSGVRTKAYNYTQIFKNEVEHSGTQMAVKQVGIPNELQHQLQFRGLELKDELADMLINGIRSSSAGSDTVYRTAGGIREFIMNFGGTAPNVIASNGALDDASINALAKLCHDNGVTPNVISGPAEQIVKVGAINADKIRIQPSDRVRGTYVTSFLTDMGVELALQPDRWHQAGEIMVLDTNRIKVLPLQGRQWQMQPLAKTGDGFSAMTIGEYTVEVRNGTKAHALRTGLTA